MLISAIRYLAEVNKITCVVHVHRQAIDVLALPIKFNII